MGQPQSVGLDEGHVMTKEAGQQSVRRAWHGKMLSDEVALTETLSCFSWWIFRSNELLPLRTHHRVNGSKSRKICSDVFKTFVPMLVENTATTLPYPGLGEGRNVGLDIATGFESRRNDRQTTLVAYQLVFVTLANRTDWRWTCA